MAIVISPICCICIEECIRTQNLGSATLIALAVPASHTFDRFRTVNTVLALFDFPVATQSSYKVSNGLRGQFPKTCCHIASSGGAWPRLVSSVIQETPAALNISVPLQHTGSPQISRHKG